MSHLPPQLSLSSPQLSLSTKPALPTNSPPCLENGRAILHDSPYLARVSSMSEALYNASTMTPNGFGVEPSAFYPLNGAGQALGLERSPDLWKSVHHPSLVYPIDPMLAVHPYSAFYGGLDLNNAARRKNATRETTSALKAWLYEHRKNPYPTKGEKIMLAIITKMTLTQVSTWFANARRRLKKESKLGYKDKDLDDSDVDSIGSPDREDDVNERLNSTLSSSSTIGDNDDVDIKVTSDLSDISDAETEKEDSTCPKLPSSSQPNSSANQNSSHVPTSGTDSRLQSNSGTPQQSNEQLPSNPKPKIWSIDEIMNKDTCRTKNTNSSTSVGNGSIETTPTSFRYQSSQNIQKVDSQLQNIKPTSDNSLFKNTVFQQLSHRKNIPETALNLAIGDKTGLPDSRTGRCETSIASDTSS